MTPPPWSSSPTWRPPPRPYSDEAPREAFHVYDGGSINWVVRRIVEARSYAEHVEAWAEKERARTDRRERFFFWRYRS